MLNTISYSQVSYVHYFNKINEAEYQYSIKNYSQALEYFEQAVNSNAILRRDVYLYAELLCVAGEYKKAKNILEDFANRGYVRENLFFSNPNFIKLKNDTTFINKLLQLSYNKNIVDVQLSKFVDSINHIEDSLRSLVSEFPDYEDAKGWEEFYEKFPFYFNFHLYFMEYCRKNGYPSFLKSGSDLARLILIHISPTFSIELEKIMFSQLTKGELLPIEFATVADKPSFFSGTKVDCKYYVLKQCVNPTNWNEIIQNRRSIGLSTYFNGFQAYYPSFKWPKLEPKITNK